MHLQPTIFLACPLDSYFHGSLGDALWFKTWAPSSNGALAGACIALIFLAIIERFLVAARVGLEESWKLE
jgi:copper transporter 1